MKTVRDYQIQEVQVQIPNSEFQVRIQSTGFSQPINPFRKVRKNLKNPKKSEKSEKSEKILLQTVCPTFYVIHKFKCILLIAQKSLKHKVF